MRHIQRTQLPSLLLAQVLPAMASLIAVIVTARFLGPSGRGQIAFALTVISIASVISTFGLYVQVASFPRSRSSSPPVETLAALLTTNVAVGGAVLLLSGRLAVGFDGLSVALIILGTMVISYITFGQRVLQARVSSSRFLLISAAQSAAILLATVTVPVLASVGAFLATWLVLQILISGLVSWLLYSDRVFGKLSTNPTARVKQAIQIAAPVAAGLISQILIWRSDTVILGLVSGPETVGLYSVAVAVTSLAWLPAEAFTLLVYSEAVRLGAATDEFRLRVRSLALKTAVVSALCAALFTLGFAYTVDRVLPGFGASTGILAILALGVAPAGVARLLFAAAGLRKRRRLLWTYATAGSVLSLVYIPAAEWAGARGVALASAIIYCLMSVLLLPVLWQDEAQILE